MYEVPNLDHFSLVCSFRLGTVMSKRMRFDSSADLSHTFAVVTPVKVVCGSYTAIAALPHVSRTVDAYLHDLWSTWTLESASEAGIVSILNRLLAQEWTGVSRSFREKRFENAFTNFFQRNYSQVHVLSWWTSVYFPTLDPAVIIPRMVQQAIEFNKLDVLEWLHDQGKLALHLSLEGSEWISCQYPQIVYWLHEHARGIVTTLVLHDDYYGKKEYFAFVQWAHAHRESTRSMVYGMRFPTRSGTVIWNCSSGYTSSIQTCKVRVRVFATLFIMGIYAWPNGCTRDIQVASSMMIPTKDQTIWR